MASTATRSRLRPVLVLVVAAACLLGALALGSVRRADAQLLETTTTTEAPPAETTIPTTTEPPTTEPPTTEAPATTARPAPTAPPATRAPTTTEPPPPPTVPETVPTTAPPEAPVLAPTTTAFVPERVTITQDTPDLGGVMALWLLGILGTVATMALTWWRRRTG